MNNTLHKAQRLINHVALVLDGSGSMAHHAKNVVKVADEQIRHLALKSEEMSQETRVSIYRFFDKEVRCLIFDMDVMRLPSIAELYSANGGTPLVDAVVKSQEDLATTSQLYGDHAFLSFVLTDGEENTSNRSWTELVKYTKHSAENWTVGFLVPNAQGITYLTRAGVDRDSIVVWDAGNAAGMIGAGKTIVDTTTAYMTARASGVRGTKSLFTTAATGAANVNAKTVQATLTPLNRADYSLHDVTERIYIQDFVRDKLGLFYLVGKGFYQFTKPETVQGGKEIVVVDKATGQAYGGKDARQLIGLQWGVEAKVKPDDNPSFDIFVQSHSVNRNLIPGQKFLLMGPFSKSQATKAPVAAPTLTPVAHNPITCVGASGNDAQLVLGLIQSGVLNKKSGRSKHARQLGISERRVMNAFKDPTVQRVRT